MAKENLSTKQQTIFFIVIATLISGLTREPFFGFYRNSEYSFLTTFALVTVLIGWGPAFAAYLTQKLSNTSFSSYSLFGNWKIGSWLSFATLPVILLLVGIPNEYQIQPNLLGFIIGLLLVLYTLGEEIGWRGYLNARLKPSPVLFRAIFIGTVWWFWHLAFVKGNLNDGIIFTGGLLEHLKYWGILVAISTLFVALVDRNQSVVQVASFHAVGNVAIFAGGLNFVGQEQRFKIAAIALVILLIVDFIWQKQNKRTEAGVNSI